MRFRPPADGPGETFSFMITTVSTTAALNSALASARPGDVIQLATGTYSGVAITARNFASDVTITSVDPSAPAVIRGGMVVTSSSGLTFTGLEFDSTGATSGQPFVVSDSRDIHFANVSVHGSMDGNPKNDGGGLFFRRSTDVSVDASEFQQLSQGVQHMNSNVLSVTNSSFHDLRVDGIMGGGSSNVTLGANSFRDFYPAAGDHPDAIQFFTSATTTAARDITIINNQIVRGVGSKIQGIFIRDEMGDQVYDRLTISGNLVSGTSYHGVTLLHATNSVISKNVVQGFTDMKSWILRENVTNSRFTDNITNELVNWGGSSGNNLSPNTIVGLAADNGAWAKSVWSAIGAADHQVLAGGSGADTLLGGKGNDSLSDAGGANLLRGDDGADSVAGGSAYDDIGGGTGDDTVDGKGGDDWVRGGDGNDRVLGGDGADALYGDAGSDTLEGGLGVDVLQGGLGADLLKGGEGGDWLLGGGGSDILTGGAGADVFVSYGAGGIDRVTDFAAWEGDRVQLASGTTWSVAQVGQDTVVTIGGGGQVILANVSLQGLQTGWLFTG